MYSDYLFNLDWKWTWRWNLWRIEESCKWTQSSKHSCFEWTEAKRFGFKDNRRNWFSHHFLAADVNHPYWSKDSKHRQYKKQCCQAVESRSSILWRKFPISKFGKLELHKDDVLWRICQQQHLWWLQAFCPQRKLHCRKLDTTYSSSYCRPVQNILEKQKGSQR